ncbi:hypothetical protein [Streptacidiphilus jiangxiensis]|uniref:Ribbon-helix-helix protein, copG family n=1 Tax=Streptacidiphilus jiangxiensis TaxID=235985 RepID=A0A1H8ARS9_STRJI|nr:hypothetical protein [Streptacidiphilus jiangxiensis]SEM72519.1 hypothetical protein SAMN05414137_14815 [Streptacidiphilus jiangxiensis]
MPRNPVINRNNADPLTPRKIAVTDDGMAKLKDTAARLHVSMGSVVDAMVREAAEMPPEHLANVLLKHELLTPAEFRAVMRVLGTKEKDTPTPDGDEGGAEGQ